MRNPRSCLGTAAALASAALLPGCERRPSPAPTAQVSPSPLLGPAEVILRIHSLYECRDFEGLTALLVTNRSRDTIEFLKAVSDLLQANERLRSELSNRFGRTVFGRWDLSPMRNNLGPFSAELRIISQRFIGDGAEVVAQQGEDVPLLRLRLICGADGRWRYEPDPPPQQALRGLRLLAETLDSIADETRRGSEQVAIAGAIRDRLAPQLLRLASGLGQPESTAAAELEP